MKTLYNALCKRYGTEYIAECVVALRELSEAAIGSLLLFGGIIAAWFIG